jgi:hypothetical protein
MIRATQERAARKRYRQIAPVLNEQSRRRLVALEAQRPGRGGVSITARIAGLARSTIYHGLSDISNNVTTPPGRIRKQGAGRKKKTVEDPTILVPLWLIATALPSRASPSQRVTDAIVSTIRN